MVAAWTGSAIEPCNSWLSCIGKTLTPKGNTRGRLNIIMGKSNQTAAVCVWGAVNFSSSQFLNTWAICVLRWPAVILKKQRGNASFPGKVNAWIWIMSHYQLGWTRDNGKLENHKHFPNQFLNRISWGPDWLQTHYAAKDGWTLAVECCHQRHKSQLSKFNLLLGSGCSFCHY